MEVKGGGAISWFAFLSFLLVFFIGAPAPSSASVVSPSLPEADDAHGDTAVATLSDASNATAQLQIANPTSLQRYYQDRRGGVGYERRGWPYYQQSYSRDGRRKNRHHPRNKRHKSRAVKTCDRHPMVCHARGSPGPYCCRKRCVNLKKDNLNCGRCGKRCGFGQACCNGRCLNVMFDGRNCGGCGKKCRNRSRCRYGMCGYGY